VPALADANIRSVTGVDPRSQLRAISRYSRTGPSGSKGDAEDAKGATEAPRLGNLGVVARDRQA